MLEKFVCTRLNKRKSVAAETTITEASLRDMLTT